MLKIIELHDTDKTHIISWLGGLYSKKKCDRGLGNAAQGRRPRQHFKPEVKVFHFSDRPKPANNTFIFFPTANWPTRGFVYPSLSLKGLTCRLQTIRKKI